MTYKWHTTRRSLRTPGESFSNTSQTEETMFTRDNKLMEESDVRIPYISQELITQNIDNVVSWRTIHSEPFLRVKEPDFPDYTWLRDSKWLFLSSISARRIIVFFFSSTQASLCNSQCWWKLKEPTLIYFSLSACASRKHLRVIVTQVTMWKVPNYSLGLSMIDWLDVEERIQRHRN